MAVIRSRRADIPADLPEVVPFALCPAKTFQRPDGRVAQGRSVLNHCEIVGEVARALIARFPENLRTSLFPEGSILVAASHDIGKVSPCFVEKIRRACTPELTSVQALPGISPELESGWGGHAGVSQLTANAINAPDYIPEIMGQHHGFSPPLSGQRAHNAIFGGPAWQDERVALVDELKVRLGTDWPTVDSAPEARVLAGLTSVSDWIGSGEYFENPASPWKESVGAALDAAGFLPVSYKKGMSFEQVFSFAPREAQHQLIDQVKGAGVYVLEAPMGLGKTEAALYVAYKMLERGEATGIYFALPTQLTSNKIYERFNSFLSTILDPDCKQRSLLLHGNAWLLDTQMGEEGKPGGPWFDSAKRGLLAPFAVGTIDQALMAAMNVKHGFVRAFGLAGKVVILDEVHTYDAYTGTLLDALVALLRKLHCTVIILSATLNHERREMMLGCSLSSQAYPLITSVPADGQVFEAPVAPGTDQDVHVQLVCDDALAVEEALRRAEQGQQVLWIENTVIEAQERYLDIASRAADIGVDCGLLHSRYTADDRQALEDKWVNQFGKAGWGKRAERGRILVGTQVLEQSLDIDADFMVSRFAPTDMLLQRMGRLWRHSTTPRHSKAICETWLLAPSLESAMSCPEDALGRSAFVYSPYVLCRSLEVWQGLSQVGLPSDIRDLIERTYHSRDEDQIFSTMLSDLDNGTRMRKGRLAMKSLARITLAEAGNTLPESRAQTRYSETDNFDVLLVIKIAADPASRLTRITLLNGESWVIPWNRQALDKSGWRKLTATLMRQVVSVRPGDAPKSLSIDLLKNSYHLHHCFFLGHPDWPQDECVLRIALVDQSGELNSLHGTSVHDKHNLNYRDDLGYRVVK